MVIVNLKLVFALLALTGLVLAQEQLRNQEQLEEKVSLYWAVFVASNYRAAYEMYPAYARARFSYQDWLNILGISDGQQEHSGYRLLSVEIGSIVRPDDPRFSNYCEIFVRLYLESERGIKEFAFVSNVWEMDEQGNWAPSMPVALGP